MFLVGTELDGTLVDMEVARGKVVAIHPAGSLVPPQGAVIRRGGRVTAPLAEPHVHLDATLLGARSPNRSGTLREGIANWARLRPDLTAEDVRERALMTIEAYVAHGTTRIRTHVDTGSLVAVEALLALREEVAATGVELQVVAFPQEGILRAPGRREAWEEAVRLGCDAVGAIPHFERTQAEGAESLRLTFELAERYDRRIDVHCDETDDPHSRHLETICALALDRGMGERVVCGHCTAMHSYENPHAAKVIELVAESGVQVVANPLDNVVLQGRYDSYPRRRGLTRVDQLWDAGAVVGIGHDSVQDPWYRLGTANLLDAAYMLVHLGHLTSEEQMHRAVRALHVENHRPFGGALPVAPGNPVAWWADVDPVESLRKRAAPEVMAHA